jgi:hypothetical protein
VRRFDASAKAMTSGRKIDAAAGAARSSTGISTKRALTRSGACQVTSSETFAPRDVPPMTASWIPR